MHIAFFSHRSQLPYLNWVARQLVQQHGCFTSVWTLGQYAADVARKGPHQEVVDLLPKFSRLEPSSDQHEANLAWLKKVEMELGEVFWREDAAQDRYFRGLPTAEVNQANVAPVWDERRVAAFLRSVGEEVVERLQHGEVDAVITESNSADYRLVRRLCVLYKVPSGFWASARFWKRIYIERGLGLSWEECVELYRYYQDHDVPAATNEEAKRKLRQIRTKRQLPTYMEAGGSSKVSLLERLQGGGLSGYLRDWLRSYREPWDRNPRQLPGNLLSPWGRVRRYLQVRRSVKYYRRQLVRDFDLGGRRFAAYFLHVQPEATVESMAFDYQDQVATIRNFSAALPADVSLVVKEHQPMIGRRSREFYAELAHMPTVTVVPDTIHSHSLIENADVVLTLTGTVALEAMIYGVPAVALGDVFHTAFEGIHRPNSWLEVRALLADPRELRAAEAGDAVRALAAMYDASQPGIWPPRPNEQSALSEATVEAIYENFQAMRRPSALVDKQC